MDFRKKSSICLFNIQNEITIIHGNKYDDLTEQLMSVTYIKPNDIVLENRRKYWA